MPKGDSWSGGYHREVLGRLLLDLEADTLDGDLAGSLAFEERLFWKYPNIEKYKTLLKLAKQLNRWNDLRAQIINELEKKNRFDFLITLYLEEKDVDNALTTLEKLPER